jgi:rod shape-determining protein MreD
VRVNDVVRSAFAVFVVLIIQQTFLDSVRLGGAHPDAMLLLPVAAGYAAGPERGAAFGFVAGLVTDLFLPTTFGLSALVFCLVGFATGLATTGLVRTSWWLPPVVAAAATATGLVVYAILGTVLGEPGMLNVEMVPALIIAVPAAVVLATPVLRLVAWAVPPPSAGPGNVPVGGVR